jgi:L-arabinonolactonase
LNAELLVDAQARLGECVLWCEQTGNLYWTDIEAATLSRWHAADGSLRHWTLPERVGSFALCQNTHQGATQLLLGLASGVALFNTETQALTPITPVEPDLPTTRINDGRCDAQGRFVFGMFNQAADEAAIGHFYRVNADLQVERLLLPRVACANSIAFSPEGTTMYFTDSPTRQIWCADYHANGRIGPPRPFVKLADDEGFPDGSTVDAEGGLWNAQWKGNCVVRYSSAGVETDRIPVPATQVTCMAFGGSQLDRLFITSARVGLGAQALRDEPRHGGVFAVQPGRRGRLEHRFVTDHYV